MMTAFRLTAVLILAAGPPASADEAQLCLDAARAAAAASDVPLSVLLAITRTETGRDSGDGVEPWPWTVNREGEGFWFDTRAEAIAFAEDSAAAGRDSFDTGCFQINYRWHGENFASVADMFDPRTNAFYAAEFLSRLYRESGDWSVAAGAYHSRTEVHATRYRARFDALRAEAVAAGADSGGPVQVARSADAFRDNTFPLLQPREGRRAPGSLVPLDGG